MAKEDAAAEAGEGVIAPEDEAAKAAEGQDGGEEGAEEPNEAVVALAHDMGWRPKEEFKGDPETWKPAAEFIRAGHEIQRNLGRELKSLRTTVDTMQRTSTTLLEQQLEEQRTKLAQKYEAAVEDGDAKGAAETLRSLDKLDEQQPAKPTLSPEAQSFQERHASWLGKDALATKRAITLCNELHGQGYTQSEQLEMAERTIKREFPELFPAPAKRQAATHESSRAAGKTNGKKGFADLPPEAQTVALDMENRLNIPRDTYATNYFNQQPAQRRA